MLPGWTEGGQGWCWCALAALVCCCRGSILDELEVDESRLPTDVLAQQMKFVCCLKMFMEELATLASGAEVESGKLRSQLYAWLEREVHVLRRVCHYNATLLETQQSGQQATGTFRDC